MSNYYWNDWYAGWGWFLWFGMIFLIFSSFGNWGYTYQAHRRFRNGPYIKDATDILNERYAKGEIDREQFNQIKTEIQISRFSADKNRTTTDQILMRPQTNT
jgi:putative membrane protein